MGEPTGDSLQNDGGGGDGSKKLVSTGFLSQQTLLRYF